MSHCRKKQLSIFLNNKCNLGCRYCYDGANKSTEKRRKIIDVNFVKKGIIDYFANYTSREIRFFGNGEPTIELDLIKKIVKFALSKDSGSTFELQTNGFFSEDATKWIGKNINIVWVSCDGFSEIQNYYRPTINGGNSSVVVERNIRYLASLPITLGCRVTIGKKNIDKQIKIIDYFNSLGVKVVMSDPMFVAVDACNSSFSKEEAPNLIEYAKYFLKARRYAEKRGIFYGSILTVNFDEETECACRACIPYPHLTIDGHVSACDMASDASNKKMSALIYGKFDEIKNEIVYDQNAINIIKSRKAPNMTACAKCEVLKNCAGGCLGEALNETGSIFGVKPEACKAIRYLAKRMPLNAGQYPYLHP
ncbi:TPA: hypothetical protein DF272_05225 [Candidatus Falkowbacteria bacterium]|nr:hypothetical protein [Candidatus Falkowbacteria bacterium]